MGMAGFAGSICMIHRETKRPRDSHGKSTREKITQSGTYLAVENNGANCVRPGQTTGLTAYFVPTLSPGKLEAQVPRRKVIRPRHSPQLHHRCTESVAVSGLRRLLSLECGIRVFSSTLLCLFSSLIPLVLSDLTLKLCD